MIDLLSYIPQKRKNTSSGWVSFNAPCCVHKGESQDKRLRGGIKQAEDGIRDAQESRGLGDVYKRQVTILCNIMLILMKHCGWLA